MQAPVMRRNYRAIACAMLGVLALAAATVIARAWPKVPLRALAPESTAISAQNGELLRLTLAADGQYRLWVNLDEMPQRLPAAVVLYEDHWFYGHPGVNLV